MPFFLRLLRSVAVNELIPILPAISSLRPILMLRTVIASPLFCQRQKILVGALVNLLEDRRHMSPLLLSRVSHASHSRLILDSQLPLRVSEHRQIRHFAERNFSGYLGHPLRLVDQQS